MLKDMLVGTWSLVTYTMSLEDSKVVYHPYGENPIGFLIYTPYDVSVHIMRADRSQKDNLLEEKIESAENYGGYAGSYEIQDDKIVHYPKVCGFINFLQTPQIRKFKLNDNLLVLESSSFSQEHGKKTQSQLIWQRVKR
jgi:hypothetical protein